MQEWEYLRLFSWFKQYSEYFYGNWVVKYMGEDLPTGAALTELGEDGWELVAVQPNLVPLGGST